MPPSQQRHNQDNIQLAIVDLYVKNWSIILMVFAEVTVNYLINARGGYQIFGILGEALNRYEPFISLKM